MRRGDFTHVRRDTVPSLDEIVTAASQQCTQRQLCTVFMATDAAEEERLYLKSSAPASLKLVFFDRTTSTDHDRLHDAERAIVEQLLCTWADWFVGSHESTFSTVIRQEREMNRMSAASTDNVLCKTGTSRCIAQVRLSLQKVFDAYCDLLCCCTGGPCEKPSHWSYAEYKLD